VKNSSDIAYELVDILKAQSLEESPEFRDSYVAGYLGGILKNLARYPEVQEELQKEVERLKKN
jgi:hypothetical protein